MDIRGHHLPVFARNKLEPVSGGEECVASRNPGAPRNRPQCLPAEGRCCLAQVSGRRRRRRVSAIGCLGELGAGLNSARGLGTLHPFFFSLEALSPEQPCRYSSLFIHRYRGRSFLFISFFFFFDRGVKLWRGVQGERVPFEAREQEGETGAAGRQKR